MSKPVIQITIPNPCSQPWADMQPQAGGRFCNCCAKTVIDFTGYTDAQLHAFFSEHKGERVCGRFYKWQMVRPIAIPPQPHSRLYRMVLALGLTLLFAQPMDTAAQQKGRVTMGEPMVKQKVAAHVSGIRVKATNDAGKEVSGVTVAVYSGKKLVKQQHLLPRGVVAVPAGNYTVKLTCRGYKPYTLRSVTVDDGIKSAAATMRRTVPTVRAEEAERYIMGDLEPEPVPRPE